MSRSDRRLRRATGNDPRLQGMDLRYDGRTVEFRIYLNTDADLEELQRRVEAIKSGPILRGEKLDQIIVAVSEVDADEAAGLWDAVFRASEDYVRREGKA